jgi:hypothetical protein
MIALRSLPHCSSGGTLQCSQSPRCKPLLWFQPQRPLEYKPCATSLCIHWIPSKRAKEACTHARCTFESTPLSAVSILLDMQVVVDLAYQDQHPFLYLFLYLRQADDQSELHDVICLSWPPD